jgi:hypothetical protein
MRNALVHWRLNERHFLFSTIKNSEEIDEGRDVRASEALSASRTQNRQISN